MSEVYTVGSLADVIKNSSQSKKIKSNEDEVSKLTALFSAPKKIPDWKVNNKSSVTDGNSKSKITEKYPEKKEQNSKKTNTDNELKGEKKEKKKQFNGDKKINVPVKKSKNLQIVGTTPNTKKSTKIQGYDPPPGIVHESLLQGNQGSMKIEDESEKKMERKARHKNRRDKTKDLRTIFVGNLPITYDKKQLKKLFRPCGKIENVRFRCPPPADLKLPKRAIAITKAFHSERKNIISYVCFEEEESAKKALSLNGKDIDGFHIRVDICTNAKKHDKTNTVFVGNMTYDITENEIWSHFEDCGAIENVRIVRDNKTGTGKGIGYVQFKEKDSAQFALKLNQTELKGRQVRVMRCDAKLAIKKKEKLTNKKKGNKFQPKSDREQKKIGFTRTNIKIDPFQHLNDKKNKHFKKKIKSKHLRFNKKSSEHSKGHKGHRPQKTKDKKMKNKKSK